MEIINIFKQEVEIPESGDVKPQSFIWMGIPCLIAARFLDKEGSRIELWLRLGDLNTTFQFDSKELGNETDRDIILDVAEAALLRSIINPSRFKDGISQGSTLVIKP